MKKEGRVYERRRKEKRTEKVRGRKGQVCLTDRKIEVE